MLRMYGEFRRQPAFENQQTMPQIPKLFTLAPFDVGRKRHHRTAADSHSSSEVLLC